MARADVSSFGLLFFLVALRAYQPDFIMTAQSRREQPPPEPVESAGEVPTRGEAPTAPTAIVDASRHSYRPILLLLLGLFVLHAPSLLCPFFIDDYVYLEMVKHLDRDHLYRIFSAPTLNESGSAMWWVPAGNLPFFRPVAVMSFAADYLIWGAWPAGFHLTNVLLHLLATLLVYEIARRLFREMRAALVAAIIFGLHPVHHEAIAWISGRFDVLVAVLLLLATYAYMRWQWERSHGSWWWGALCLGSFALALGTKETALVWPVVIAAMEWLVRRKRAGWQGASPKRSLRTLVAPFAVFGVLMTAYLVQRWMMFGGLGKLPPPYGIDRSSPVLALWEMFVSVTQYLLDFLFFLQVDAMYANHLWLQHPLPTAIAFAVCALVLVVSCWLAWRRPALHVGAVWLLMFLAPSLLAMPGERNVYTASAGVALMMAATYLSLLRGRRDQREVTRRWVFRLGRAMLALWCVIGFVEQGVMYALSWGSERTYAQIQELVPDPARDTTFYVINISPMHSIGFWQALRQHYQRDDIRGVGLTMAASPAYLSRDQFVQTGPASAVIGRIDGPPIFSTFFDRFHRFNEPVETLPEAAERVGLQLEPAPQSYDQVRHLWLRFPHTLADPRTQILYWDNRKVRESWFLFDLFDRAKVLRFDEAGLFGRGLIPVGPGWPPVESAP